MNQKQIQIQASKEDLKGVYSNMMQVLHTKEEFVLDFFNITGNNGMLVARVILSPSHFKRMVEALTENLKRYEENFGEIPSSQSPKREIGFTP